MIPCKLLKHVSRTCQRASRDYHVTRHVTRHQHVQRAHFSSYKVAIVGSGPAGFYTAQEILRCKEHDFQIDILERAPVPFGLVRYGVAPDHPEVKNCITTFEEIAGRSNVQFLGNITVGKDIKVHELLERYHTVVLAYGAGSDNRLGIPGETARGCIASGEFVGWFNGVPEHAELDPDLTGEVIPIIGHGNVALDCARILSAPVSHLENTDISTHALDAIRTRRTNHINLYGRRGILQFQGNVKEVREFTKLAGVHLSVESDNVEEVRLMIGSVPRPKKRLTELLLKHATASSPAPSDIGVCFKFGWSPVEIKTDGEYHVCGVVLRKNVISGDMMNPEINVTSYTVQVPCKTIITSIGYKVVRLPGVPFCEKTNKIPEHFARVLDAPGGAKVPGLYTTGWARRGSDGVMATTITDAANTARSILDDFRDGSRDREVPSGNICTFLRNRNVKFVTFDEWKKIDSLEKEKGKSKGKPREKIVNYSSIIDSLGK